MYKPMVLTPPVITWHSSTSKKVTGIKFLDNIDDFWKTCGNIIEIAEAKTGKELW